MSVLEGGDEEIDPDDFGNQLDGNIGEDHESS